MSCDDWPDDWGGFPNVDENTRRRVDDLLAVLADRHRRDLLYHLPTMGVTDVETLATRLAAADEDVPPDEVPPERREQVQVQLVHTHLPKLADLGAIEFDRRSGAVRSDDLPPMLDHLVESCSTIESTE